MIVEEQTALGIRYTVYNNQTKEKILYTYLESTAIEFELKYNNNKDTVYNI